MSSCLSMSAALVAAAAALVAAPPGGAPRRLQDRVGTPAGAQVLAAGTAGVDDAVAGVEYLAAAPRGDVDAIGLVAARVATDAHDASGVSLLVLQGNGEGSIGDFMGRASVRLLVTDFLPKIEPDLFFQELFAAWRRGDLVQVKAGKFYQAFGRDWDYGFSGPLVFNNDLKMRPDVGVAVVGSPSVSERVDLRYALQFFALDGQGVGSLTGGAWGRDVRHRNTVVANLAPAMTFAPGIEGRVGASAKVGTSRLTANGQGASGLVTAAALDVDARLRDAGAFLEVGRQFQDSTNLTDQDINFDKSLRVPAYTYLWAGAKYALGPVTLRLNYNDQFFSEGGRETQLLPGVTYKVGQHLQLLAEFNVWLTNNRAAAANVDDRRFRDRSLYIVLTANI